MRRILLQRWLVLLALLVVMLLTMSGCAGASARATSWAGITIAGDRLYAADLLQVQVMKADSAEPVWAFPTDTKADGRGLFYATPAVTDQYVIVASQVPATGFFSQSSNVVWALDPETGRELWSFRGAGGTYVEGGVLSDGTFVIGNSDGFVYALNVDNGSLKWKFETGHRVWASPVVASGTVYIGSMDRHLYALDLADGSVIWDFDAGGAFAGRPTLWDGKLYIGAFNDKFYALDAETGDVVWSIAGKNWFWGGADIYDGILYTADVNGNVYAVNASTGAEVWQQALGEQVRAAPAMSEDGGLLFVGGQKGNLYALDTKDGFVLWTSEAEGQVLSAPVVSGSTVYEALTLGKYRIRALHVENGREIWAYPPQAEQTNE